MDIFCNGQNGYEEIVSYGPRWWTEYKEMDANYRYAGWTLNLMAHFLERILNNQFVRYADKQTISMYENLLGISSDGTLEERRNKVDAYLHGLEHISASSLKEIIKICTGDDVEITFPVVDEEKHRHLKIDIQRNGSDPESLPEVMKIFNRLIPAHLICETNSIYEAICNLFYGFMEVSIREMAITAVQETIADVRYCVNEVGDMLMDENGNMLILNS